MTKELDRGRLAGDWGGMGDKVRKDWGKLTEEDISQAGGRRDLLLERIRERYGLSEGDAERQLTDWASRQGDASNQAVDPK
ncbi:CsbD family protein [Roseomonas populi]|uniref:CsbD family protein n=1 Tax=Roseomonas populi TaxID=3121582 RepID=A0ABT1X882_9PROT|nr:CsbD family protein [Roseomonas pecuniae]MCR0984315.1 CsbD family protein [Roseomonas pecuniae]